MRRTDQIVPGLPHYCSTTCANRANRKFGADNPSWKQSPRTATSGHPVVTYTCRNCGVVFTSTSRMPAYYCSRDCRWKWYWKHHTRKPLRHSAGYVMVYKPDHPRASHGIRAGWVFEHILVWEQSHNQPLAEGQVVHHLNGIKSDNRIENLIALTSRKHSTVLAAKAKRIQELEGLLRNQLHLC